MLDPIISFDKVSFAYASETPALFEDVSWQVSAGTWCSVLGPNGVGKSTLLKLISGEVQPTSGKVKRQFEPHEMAYLPQYRAFEGTEVLVSQIVETCQKGLSTYSMPLDEWAEVFEIDDISQTRVSHLSEGQRQRLVLGLYLLKPAKILILDEPTSGCDIAHATAIYELVASIREKLGITIIHVSHEIHQVLMFSKEVICLGAHARWHRHVGDVSHESLEDIYGCELHKMVKLHEDVEKKP